MKEPNEALAPEAPPGTPEANLSGPAKPGKSPLLREVRSLAVRLAVFAAVLWVLLTQVYLVTQASGSEKFPAVMVGDLVLGIRLEKDYAMNDVVVYERSGRLRVGRGLARGGDIVTLSESGVVEVNGAAQGGGAANCVPVGALVGEDQIVVMLPQKGGGLLHGHGAHSSPSSSMWALAGLAGLTTSGRAQVSFMRRSSSTSIFQTRCTEEMDIFSRKVWISFRSGPKDTQSSPGNLAEHSPHSSPAWMARTLGSEPNSRL